MKGAKVTLHVQLGLPQYVVDRFAKCGIHWIKLMDPPGSNPFPEGVKTIGRVYVPDGDSNAMIWDGALGARAWWDRIAPIVLTRPWVYAWEGPNEPQPADNQAFRRALNAFTVELAKLHHDHGKLLVGLNLGVTHFTAMDYWADVRQAVEAIDYLGLHEYNAPHLGVTGDDGVRWWVGRWQMQVNAMRSFGIRVPRIIIGEHGIDLGVWTPQNPHVRPQLGWQAVNNNAQDYAGQLIWADSQVYADPLVEAVCVYTAAAEHTWRSFEVTEEVADMLAGYIRGNPPQEGGYEEPKPVRFVDMRGKLYVNPTKPYPIGNTGAQVIIHHSATPNKDKVGPVTRIRRIAEYHVSRWDWPGIAYHYVVDRAGVVYQTLDHEQVGNHSGKASVNKSSLAVCLLGTYTNERPPDAMRDAVVWLLDRLAKPYQPHFAITPTACPGKQAWAAITERMNT